MNENEKPLIDFFSFPLRFLKDIFKNHSEVLDNIIYFAVYQEWQKDKKRVFEPEKYWEFASQNNILFNSVHNKKELTKEILKCIRDKYNKGKTLFEDKESGDVYCKISDKIFWDFYKSKKSDYEILLLSGFLAAKTIIGKFDYKATNFNYLFARMAGNKTYCESDKKNWAKQIQDIAGKEYRRNKFLSDLEEFWHVAHYSEMGMRGFLISVKLDIVGLSQAHYLDKKKTSKKELREMVILKAIEEIKAKQTEQTEQTEANGSKTERTTILNAMNTTLTKHDLNGRHDRNTTLTDDTTETRP